VLMIYLLFQMNKQQINTEVHD